MLKRLRCWVGLHDLQDFEFNHCHMEGPHRFRVCVNCGAMYVAKEKVR